MDFATVGEGIGNRVRVIGAIVIAVVVMLGTAACESGPVAPAQDAAFAGDLAPDLAPRPPASCSAATCLPPACCGAACKVSADCCAGTLCQNSRCVPAVCASCGEVGCVVDFTACTGTCARPACCLQTCAMDSDCCAGTRCRTDTQFQKRCTPAACDTCTGFRPICEVSVACAPTCKPPPSCGMKCMTSDDCGLHNQCRAFLNGSRLCVPSVFDATCNQCGQGGCLFHPDQCTIECPPAPGADLGVPDMTAAADLATPALADAAPATDGSTCKSCCAACVSDAECCGGQLCRSDGTGKSICTPSSCAQCSYGCRFTCP